MELIAKINDYDGPSMTDAVMGRAWQQSIL